MANARIIASLRQRLARTEEKLGEAERENHVLRQRGDRTRLSELEVENEARPSCIVFRDFSATADGGR